MAAHPSPNNFPNVQFPRIEADIGHLPIQRPGREEGAGVRSSTFHLTWKGADGVWTYTTRPAGAGLSQLLDDHRGAMVLDPGTNAYIGYGTCATGLNPAGCGFLRLKEVPHGNVLIKNYYAKSIKAWRAHFCLYAAGVRHRQQALPGAVPAAWRRGG